LQEIALVEFFCSQSDHQKEIKRRRAVCRQL